MMGNGFIVLSVVMHHLLAPVGDVGAQVGQSFQGGEALACPAVFGCIDDLPLLIRVLHTLLGEGSPDDVTGQVFHGRFLVGRDAVAAEDVETGMPPC